MPLPFNVSRGMNPVSLWDDINPVYCGMICYGMGSYRDDVLNRVMIHLENTNGKLN